MAAIYRRQFIEPSTINQIGIILFTGHSSIFIEPTTISKIAMPIKNPSMIKVMTETV
ncbi:hypothetical protein KIN20_000937 [Parelaphostrongylus tenuis]|uniref:Uncharacterized protein n=1 Tax=Parelaphostrongylus tenuis TaxID=148309 RepID=A0AAD5ME23_PARTN|nr:hypothetical protein KIN20_000937 [Parelaphostrongylus tenuis]